MEQKLREYAKLLIEVGLGVRKGQTLVLACPVECAFFARMCASAAYDAGAREVVMNWKDDYLAREKYLRASDDVFDTVPEWQKHFYNDYAASDMAYLAISATDPETLRGVERVPAPLKRRQMLLPAFDRPAVAADAHGGKDRVPELRLRVVRIQSGKDLLRP